MRALALSLLLSLCAALQAAELTLPQGTILGRHNNGVLEFLGIPYARPPLGDLRWQPPEPLPAGTETVDATAVGPACLQPHSPYLTSPAGYSEDCLTLNVWTPGLEGKRPVMVWIHGGGFRTGSNVIPGEVFAERGVVVVAINYRLGPLGFFAHEALPGDVANFGLLDMELALRWVQSGIAKFGGDPDKVTIFGVSAGGQAVNLLMASPRTSRLFHRAIAQSGYGTWALPRTNRAPLPAPRAMDGEPAPSAEVLAAAIVARVGETAENAAALRELSGQALVEALDGFQLPIVDGTSLPEEPGIVFLRGEQQAVPLMTGGNSYEGAVMPGAAITQADVRRYLGPRVSEARALYAEDREDLWLQRLFGDYRYLLSARVLGQSMARIEQRAWLYYVDFLTKEQAGRPGTYHGMDAAYLLRGDRSDDPEVRALAEMLRAYWTNFARHGDPNGEGLPPWPAHRREQPRWMLFEGLESRARDRIIGEKLDMLETLYRARTEAAMN
jgi:para-nitrobenzyl esterase